MPKTKRNDGQPNWYAVMTTPTKEVVAAKGLRQRGYAVCLPMRQRRREYARGNRKMVVRTQEVWLRGYLFVRIGAGQSVYTVNNVPQVSTVVYVGEDPVPVSSDELDELRKYLRSRAAAKPVEVHEIYEPGTLVEFTEASSFVGFCGTVIVDTGTKIRISCMKISSNPVTVTKRDYLRPAEPQLSVA